MEVKLNNTLTVHLQEYNRNTPRTSTSTARAAVDHTLPPTTLVSPGTWKVGRVTGLLPETIVPVDQQAMAVAQINRDYAEHRIKVWRTPSVGPKNLNGKVRAFIAHYESVWYSFWICPDDEYLYGATVMFKNNDTTIRKVTTDRNYDIWAPSRPYGQSRRVANRNWHRDGFNVDELEEFKVGKASWLKKTIYVTKRDIQEGFTSTAWGQPHVCNSGHGKGMLFNRIKNEIAKQLKATKCKSWIDSSGNVFERVLTENNSIWHCLATRRFMGLNGSSSALLNKKQVSYSQYRHNVDWWIVFLQGSGLFIDEPEFYKKPAIRKLLHKAVEESQAAFTKAQGSDSAFWRMSLVAAPLVRFYYWLHWCKTITSIWPDCPQDYLLNNYEVWQEIKQELKISSELKLWLRTNMPVASFLQVLSKAVEKIKANPEEDRYGSSKCDVRCIPIYRIRDVIDTLEAATQVLRSGKELPKPTRWRLSEWHDQAVAESWKIRNADYPLPQDMFPQPHKIVLGDKTFCFIQPQSAHQLAQWGKAARNCVGNSNYSAKIRQQTTLHSYDHA